jgi:hypothetical protein
MSTKVYSKLLKIQESVDAFVKDGKNLSDKYDYVSSEQVLDHIRPLLLEHRLLLMPEIVGHGLTVGETRSGTTRFMTEIDMVWKWVDCDSGEELKEPFYAQGVDLAGEKGVGKALTYSEKYYLMKVFHVPTSKDDPDAGSKTKDGEGKQKGTQAGKETADMQRKAIAQMAAELSRAGGMKVADIFVFYTKNEQSGYVGADCLADISHAALPVVYAKMGAGYKKQFGYDFKLMEVEE